MTSKIASFASFILFSFSAFAQQGPPPQDQGMPADPRLANNPGISAAPPDEAGPGVARISFMNGDVSVRRGDSGDAVAAALNAPLLAADTIATGPQARAEIQFDSAHRVRLGNEVEARLAELQNGKFRIELAHGTVALSVTRDSNSQAEVSTPNVSMRPIQRGLYRLTVGDDGLTTITVRAGEAEIYSQKGTERLSQGQSMEVRGNADDPEFQIVAAIARDEWDTWNEQRDMAVSHAESYRYVNPDIPGAEELDGQGTWVNDPAYGEVWAPQVGPDWAPYRVGRWVWEDYYGWTWVSGDPWGWAPYHYGNWYYGSVGWCWYPGIFSRPVFWRPGLVAFFGFGGGGGIGFGFGFGGFGSVGWLPLAPFEPFHPWYGRGFAGFGRGYLARNYNVTNVNIANVYRNARVNGAISGVASSAFSGGHFGAISRVNVEQVRSAGLVRGPLPIAPTANNLRFSNRTTAVSPTHFPNAAFSNPSRSATAAQTPFAQQRQAIQQSTRGFAQTGTRGYPSTGQSVQRSASIQRSAPQTGATPNSAWARFGAPGGSAATNQVRPGSNPAATAGWARFGSPSQGGRSVQNPASAYPNRSFYGGQSSGYPSASSYGQSAQPLRLSQPIVHNRAYDPSPRSYPSTTYSAPRSTYSQPAQRSSAPQRSSGAPQASRSSGGGGHAASSGGGHGGGGSRR